MNINSVLKKEGIEIKSKLDVAQVNQIASIVSSKLCQSFPEHNLNENAVSSSLAELDMYFAKMPKDSASAKYFSQNNAIYFNRDLDLENLDTLVIHECIHAIQEIKSPRGKLLKLGLFDLKTNKGQGINEAAVQLMSSMSTETKSDTVKYYNMTFSTPSPLFYPIETALINQIVYFTGSYPLFHSTLHSNHIFKNTFVAKSSEKVYSQIESNFDLLIYYEELLSLCFHELSNYSDEKQSFKKIKRMNAKIDSIKSNILQLSISTQNMIIENCFENEFDLIRDTTSLNTFQQRLYDFNQLLITADSYNFYTEFYAHMMSKLEEKRELIKANGTLNYLNDLQNDLLDLERDHLGLKFFHRLFDKLKLLFEQSVRDRNHNDI